MYVFRGCRLQDYKLFQPVNTFEPEATADYTDPDVPTNCSVSKQVMSFL